MNVGSITYLYKHKKCPLLQPSCELRQLQNPIPRTSQGLPVVQPFFNPYLQNAVALYPLLSMLCKMLDVNLFHGIAN